jgi:cytidine deaminase
LKNAPEHQYHDLIQSAINASKNAYNPYSNYTVGAALQASDGTVFTGCNIECASYSPTTCAERTALVKAISEGYRQFDKIVVVTQNAGSPCGVCRQFLYEFSPELTVIIADLDGQVHHVMSLSDLLPLGFGPSKLEI